MARRLVFVRYLRASLAIRYSAFIAMFGVLLAALALSEATLTHRRIQDFYPARAELLGKSKEGGRGGPYYYLFIRYFDRAGGPHVRRMATTKKEYTTFRTGDEIRTYVSGIDPRDAWLTSTGQPGYRRSEVLGVLAGLAFLPAAIVLDWLRRRATVLHNGKPVTGRVEKAGRDYRLRFSTKRNCQLHWSCVGPDGRRWRGKSLHIPKQIAGRWKRGDEISVYFDPAHPRIAEVDVYGWRPSGSHSGGAS